MFAKNMKRILLILSTLLLSACNFTDTLECIPSETITHETESDGESADGELTVQFIDVGQGDCTLLVSAGHAMLIDCGDSNQGTKIQNYLIKQGIKKLDYLILTHPDADHIGGAPVIITKFDIEQVYMSDYEKQTKTYEKVIDALEYKRLGWETPTVGDSMVFGDTKITFLAPSKQYDDPNNASIAFIVSNGENSFLFSGDAETEAEADILNTGYEIKADVYHVGHHGSRTSSSENFLETMNPSYAVISCGEDNDYGHPHSETLNHLRERDIKVFRTDEQGTTIASSDGKNITWSCSPSDSWKSGEQKGSLTVDTTKTENAHNEDVTYILNQNSKKFHNPNCESVQKMSSSNKVKTNISRDEILRLGYSPCKICNP